MYFLKVGALFPLKVITLARGMTNPNDECLLFPAGPTVLAFTVL